MKQQHPWRASPRKRAAGTAGLGTLAALAVMALTASTAAYAQSTQGYPSRPIRIVVPNTPASAMDTVTRLLAQRLNEAWGQPVVVDDRPGASGIIGHELVAKSPADGYTLLFTASAGTVISPLLSKVPYDTVRDFAPLTLVVTSTQMLAAHPSLAAHSVGELLAEAKAKPGQLNCGSTGPASPSQLMCEMFRVMGNVNTVHVPFKGTSASITGLVSGQVQFAFASIPSTTPLVKGGRLRLLGQGGKTRSPLLPNLPTIAETLPGFEAITWFALFAPRGTPPAVVSQINSAVVKILSEPAVVRSLAEQGLEPSPSTPAALAAHVRGETERFGRLIKLAGVTAER